LTKLYPLLQVWQILSELQLKQEEIAQGTGLQTLLLRRNPELQVVQTFGVMEQAAQFETVQLDTEQTFEESA